MRIGIGYDVHAFAKERKLILAGVHIPYERGLAGHSDADVLTHAIMDAILGALALGDIGQHFPDTSQDFKDADSLLLLREVVQMMNCSGYQIGNCDSVIMAQKPKLASYLSDMRENLSRIMQCTTQQVNVKATTTEKLGFVGREEGIAAQAVVLLEKIADGSNHNE